MRVPYFTVIIPTKNRRQRLLQATQSVLEQAFTDFELLIVDNDDEEATAAASPLPSDPRIRILRTGGLTMAENWETGYRAAKGQYLLLLEDKSVLKSRALATLHRLTQEKTPLLLSWPQDIFNDLHSPPRVGRGLRTGRAAVMASREVITQFLTLPRGYYEQTLPRGLNSCLHFSLRDKILKEVNQLTPPYSPDYTIAFLQLAFCDEMLHIEDCLTVYGSCKESQGGRTLKGAHSAQDLKRNFAIESTAVLFEFTPLKSNILSVALYNEFIRMQNLAGRNLRGFHVSAAQVFYEAWNDILLYQSLGNPCAVEKEQWRASFARQSVPIQCAVRYRRWKQESWLGRWLQRTRQRTWHGFVRRLKHFGSRPNMMTSETSALPFFANALEYAKWENRLMESEAL
jgi:hypothetical protein